MRSGGPTTGHCLETGCETKTCPSGQVCVAGTCKDGCDGVTCPGGQECMMGACTPVAQPDAGMPAGSGGGGGFVILGTGGQGGTTGSGGITGAGGSTSTGSGATGVPPKKIQTCSCETAEGPSAGAVALLLAGLAVAGGRRRRAAVRLRRK
jgi:MYXO-CTERM domain-containing protein